MARRISVLDDVGDQLAAPGSKSWAKWFVGQAKLRRHDLQREATSLQKIIKMLEQNEAWKPLGFVSLGMLCHAELDLDEEQLELIRQAKEGMTLQAVLGKQGAPEGNNNAAKNRENKPDNIRIVSRDYGTSSTYLRARLERDHPDIAAARARGEYKSDRAAGIAAGIVKVPSTLDVLKRAWSRADKAEKDAFRQWMGNADESP
jgi:hypothetical protein